MTTDDPESNPLLRELDAAAAARVIDELRLGPADTSSPTGTGQSNSDLPMIEGYVLTRRIGGGGGGEVYAAMRVGSDRLLAIKVLRHATSAHADNRLPWRELDTLAQLHIPGVPHIHDYGVHGGNLFIVTDLVDGRSLMDHCRELALSRDARIELLARIAELVQMLHERGIIHRDIKPSNILIDAHGDPVIIDLGIAVLLHEQAPSSSPLDRQPIGTPAFMSPEQARGDFAATSPRTDVFSLGATGFHLLTGQAPFDLEVSLNDAVKRVAQERPRDIKIIDRSVPDLLATVLNRSVDVSPERRHESAAAFAADLRRTLGRRPADARLGGVSRLLQPARCHPIATLACMSMTIVAAVFVIMWVQNVRGLDRTRINLSDVAWPRGFTIDGDYPHSLLGSAVAIGDVTGDGVAEIIIGEESRPNQQVNPWVQSTGVIHILAGTNASGAAVDIERDSLTIAGEIANAGFGGRVGVAGDLDHDGVDDLFVSSLSPETHGGDVHIIFGGPELDTNGGHRLGAIPTASIRLRQPSSDDMLGWAVAAVGDVNSDGIDDLAIGAPTSDLPGFPNVGAVYVLFGSPALRVSTDLALTALDGRNGLAIHGDRAEEQFGRSIAAAGDLDGDGTPELAIGAPMEGVGRVHVFSFASFAESDHPSTSFREVSSRHRHVITGVAVGDGTGYSVANVSDVNGDGLDDLLIGAPQIARLNADAGIAYLVFGRPGIMATPEMPLIELDGRTGMTLSGHASHANGQGDLLGLLVAAAGDFDADGLSDLAIAAPRANSGGNDSGAVYLVFGSREPIEGGNLDLRNLAWPRGLILQGSANGDEAGSAIAFGDVNGDIVTDLVVGAPRADPSSTTDAGMVYAVYGKK